MRTSDHLIIKDVFGAVECDTLLDIFDSTKRVEYVQQPDGRGISSKEEMNTSWRSNHEDKEICWVPFGCDRFEFICSLIDKHLPTDREYNQIRHIQIICYREDGLFHWHKDRADPGDRATALITLNEGFVGGNLIVEDLTIPSRRGRMVAFNNSTERWHTVSPLLKGERFVLALWLGDGTEPPR